MDSTANWCHGKNSITKVELDWTGHEELINVRTKWSWTGDHLQHDLQADHQRDGQILAADGNR